MDKTTDRLARYVTSLRYDDLSPRAIHEAKRHLVDSLGCAVGGYESEPAVIARRVAPAWSGTPYHQAVEAADSDVSILRRASWRRRDRPRPTFRVRFCLTRSRCGGRRTCGAAGNSSVSGTDGDMVPGDVIEVEISDIGVLRNYVVAETS